MQFLHRNIVPAVLLLALFCVPMPAFAALDPLTVTVDEASTELQAYTDGDILFMGASDIATLFNVEYTQDTEANTVTYTLGKTLFGKKEAVFTVDTATVSINGKEIEFVSGESVYDHARRGELVDRSVIAASINGELCELTKKLNLADAPKRIESYDMRICISSYKTAL